MVEIQQMYEFQNKYWGKMSISNLIELTAFSFFQRLSSVRFEFDEIRLSSIRIRLKENEDWARTWKNFFMFLMFLMQKCLV